MSILKFSIKLSFFLICFSAINFSGFSINFYQIDSLNKQLKIVPDTQKIKIYIQLADLYEADSITITLKYYDKGINLTQQLILKNSQSKDTSFTTFLNHKLAILYLYKGMSLQSIGDFTSAIKYFSDAYTYFIKINNLKRATDCLNVIGNIHIYKAEYDVALGYYKRALEIAEKINDIDLLSRILNNIGIIQIYIDKTDSGIEYLLKSLEYSEKLGDKKGIAYSYNNIGNIYLKRKDYKNALIYFKKALKINEDIQDKPGLARCLNNIGIIYKNLEDYESALIYFEKAISYNNSILDYQGIASCSYNIGNIYYSLKNYENAIKYSSITVKEAEKINARDELKDGYSLLAMSYDKKSDYKNALHYYKLFTTIKDSIFNEEKHKNINEIEAKYQNDKKKLEIDMLNQKNELSQIEIEKKETEIKVQTTQKYAVIAGLSLMLILAFVIYRGYRNKKKSNIILAQQKLNLEYANEEIFQQKEEIMAQAEQLELTNKELEKLSIVASETDNAVIIADRDGNIEWTNLSFTKLTGYSFEEFVDNFGRNIKQSSANQDIAQIVNKCISEKKSVSYTAKNITKSNKTLWIQTNLTPILDSNNNVTKLVAIDSDITKIKEAEEEILKQNEKITEQNKEITDSIKYASFIQNAILPPSQLMHELLKDYFLIFKPRNIVSGDFYWTKQIIHNSEKLTLLSVADCTGHGVPGAFMSMLSVSLLNEVCSSSNFNTIEESNITSNILNNLKRGIIKSLHQTGTDEEAKDGLDISLVLINKNQQHIYYSGANNPMYLIRKLEDCKIKDSNEISSNLEIETSSNFSIFESLNSTLIEFKPDKMPIGIHYKDKNHSFNSTKFNIKTNDVIYLFSDGIIDQFGGKSGKKLKITGLKKILTIISNKSLQEQAIFIDIELYNWLNPSQDISYSQLDDITILGTKI